jgi:hypothetical protein
MYVVVLIYKFWALGRDINLKEGYSRSYLFRVESKKLTL